MRFPLGSTVGSASLELATIQEGFQDVLLDVVIVVDDGRHLLAELRKILHSLFNAAVGDVVGRWLCAQVQVIAQYCLINPLR
jgi:hypothetical protein